MPRPPAHPRRRRGKLAERRGYLAEITFVSAALRQDLLACRPCTPAVFDYVTAYGRLMYRVQVKSTSAVRSSGSYQVKCSHGLVNHPYTPAEIDFLAVYLDPLDLWYIIPVIAIAHTTAFVIAPPGRPRQRPSRFEEYREAWHLLKQ